MFPTASFLALFRTHARVAWPEPQFTLQHGSEFFSRAPSKDNFSRSCERFTQGGTSIMSPSHSVEAQSARATIGTSLLTTLFRSMTRIRTTEETIAQLLDKNEIRCPTHLCTGQEAIAAGVCAALRKDDYIFGGHRSHGHYLAKGGDLRALMAELYGKATGCSRGRGGSMHLISQEMGLLGTVPLVAATIPIAVGSALASKLRRD